MKIEIHQITIPGSESVIIHFVFFTNWCSGITMEILGEELVLLTPNEVTGIIRDDV